ncbi:mediator of RNA polymerase II transcription subunit 7-like [Amphiura filiformis]|uniref:mediator of RNA polymerase II transcription subunit 7-like n=1 Tax=Amphiura filiformis TaxID=82378 RepID=UPI003B21AF5B
MADTQVVSSLPLPPAQYIANYTDEKVANGTAPNPPTPNEDQYNMFGRTFTPGDDIIRPLESQGLKRLHPKHFDHKRELKKINHSILVNFLDLLDVLITSPGSGKREEKIEDLNLLFIHMHHLINEFRPHQARETLRVMMEVQKRQRLETAERFQKQLEKVTSILQGCFSSLPDNMSNIDSKVAVKLEPEVAGLHDEPMETNVLPQKETEKDSVSFADKDRLMCNLIDGL